MRMSYVMKLYLENFLNRCNKESIVISSEQKNYVAEIKRSSLHIEDNEDGLFINGFDDIENIEIQLFLDNDEILEIEPINKNLAIHLYNEDFVFSY